MARKGLSREKVIETATNLIEEKGFNSFTLRELAERLNIKSASLYNHVDSIEDVSARVGLLALEELIAKQQTAIEGKGREEAVLSLALAYRSFVKNRPEMYKAIMELHSIKNENLAENIHHIVDPILQVLSLFNLNDIQKMNWSRILRSTMHGFSTLEQAGYFVEFPLDTDDSYKQSIQNIIVALEAQERINKLNYVKN